MYSKHFLFPRSLGKIAFHLISPMSEPIEGFLLTAFITDVFLTKNCWLGCFFDYAYFGDAGDGFEAGFVPGGEGWF